MRDARTWAQEEFGHARLGDLRRTRRLVRLAAEVAGKPAGVVTRACRSTASREAAFRLLESDDVSADEVRRAVEAAALRRCRAERRVIVPIDGTSLTITDDGQDKGLGGVGAWDKGARGLQVMTALALRPTGAPAGICAQRMWARDARSPHGNRGALGKQSENGLWLDLLVNVHRALAAVATRAMRLTQLARATPDALASTEFSTTELQALLALRQPRGQHDLASLTLALAVRWVAELGGYTGPWNGPPGTTVIGRGLHDVLVAARAFENRDKMR